jgi:S1-C subfamily serine protease
MQTDTKAFAQKALLEFDRITPRPYPCDTGWAASQSGYVVAVSSWAEEAGLRPGDKITAISGTTVASQEERTKAYFQVPVGGPVMLGLTRQGEPVTLPLPCRYQPERHTAARRTLEAASRGDWDRCIAAARETRRLAGFVAFGTVVWEHECARAKNPSMASPEGRNFASLHYELSRLRLRESRYVPGETENVRGWVLRFADDLRTGGFPTYANDLEAQLREALAAQPVARPPSGPPQPITSQGTAFAVRPDGTFLTAFHIIKDAKTITVTCPGEGAFPASVVGAARRTDLAILRADRPTPHYLSLARPNTLRPGDHVFTVGFPATDLLGTEPKFTDGSVSALSGPGDEATLIQITVPIQPGNSGGPLLNDEGRVVGVVTSTAAVVAFLEGTGTLPQNVNWAVKSEYATPLFPSSTSQAPAKSRGEAVGQVMKAACMIEAVR